MTTCVKCWNDIDDRILLEDDIVETHGLKLSLGSCCYTEEQREYSNPVIILKDPEMVQSILSGLMEAAAQLQSKYQAEGEWGKVETLTRDIVKAAIIRDAL